MRNHCSPVRCRSSFSCACSSSGGSESTHNNDGHLHCDRGMFELAGNKLSTEVFFRVQRAIAARAANSGKTMLEHNINHVVIRHGVRALTGRQRQIMGMVVDGHPSKNIAADLGISQRTVENHRASIMRKTGSTSIPALVRFTIRATVDGEVGGQVEK